MFEGGEHRGLSIETQLNYASLQFLVVEASTYGNVAELQSLPALHKAFELFIQSKGDARFSAQDPLTKWECSVLHLWIHALVVVGQVF